VQPRPTGPGLSVRAPEICSIRPFTTFEREWSGHARFVRIGPHLSLIGALLVVGPGLARGWPAVERTTGALPAGEISIYRDLSGVLLIREFSVAFRAHGWHSVRNLP
jgi:hypothetical protein